MTERDPHLQSLFADLDQDLDGNQFKQQTLGKIKTQHYTARIIRMLLLLVAAACLYPVTHYLTAATQAVSALLAVPIFAPADNTIYSLISPANSVAACAGLGFLISFAFWRKITG